MRENQLGSDKIQSNKDKKHLKTWDEAVSELKSFIIQSKKEEQEKQMKAHQTIDK